MGKMNIGEIMKPIGILLTCFLCLTACFYADHDYQTIENTAVLDYAIQHLPHTGVLLQKSDGFVYLKVDDAYIHALFPKLKAHGFHKPPYFRRPDAVGAHISVMYNEETRQRQPIEEVGQVFQFTPSKLAMVRVRGRSQYVILEVQAPELEALRKKYGLSPMLKQHAFHISLAKRAL